MFIKRITINGFRSYYEPNSLSDLSSGHNVIVGSNGCGKTNILNAIQFVLSDEFNGLTATQRHQLINESHGKRLLIAFVEIVIDNTDRRIPLDFSEIAFRRQIGLKKDQYFMNGKVTTHSDISNVLEAAGFSRSNPYYIVKQGKINEMAISSDEYRLQVMREVAGTRIYDKKKNEAMKMLTDCKQKSKQIDDCLQSLEEKLNILQNEEKDLQRYLVWDKRRRLLEYMINNRESEKVKNQILKLEEKQRKESDVIEEKRNKLQEYQLLTKNCEKKLKVISGVVEQNRKDMKDINKNIDDLSERKAKIESKINDFNEKMKFNKQNDLKISKELEELKQNISLKKKRLNIVNLKYEELKGKENALFNDLKAKQSRKLELYSKQKRKEKFRTVEERDVWIQNELPKLEKDIEKYNKRISDLKSEQMAIIKQKDNLENAQNGFDSEETNLLKAMKEEKTKLCDFTKSIRQIEGKRLELWDLENSLKEKELKLSEEIMKIESQMTKFLGSSAIIGRKSVERVLEIFERKASNSSKDESNYRPIIDGYLGQVIDCFTFEANLSKAIDVSAKNKLFHHIVKTDKIGTKIMSEVNSNKMLGDIGFIPINRLKVKGIQYPNLGRDARPLTSLIKFDKKYEKVMKFLFDRTLVCRNLEVATKFARSFSLDCVTIEGDYVSYKGHMSGGYYNNETRTDLFSKWKKIVEMRDSTRTELNKLSETRELNERKLTETQNLLSALDIQHNKTQHKIELMKTSKVSVRNQLIDLNKKYESITKSIASMESMIPSMVANRDSFQSELGLSLDSQLTVNENNELQTLLKDIERLNEEHSSVCKKRNKMETEKSSLEIELDKHLEQRKNELEFTLIDSKVMINQSLVENESFDCELIDQKIDSLRKQLEEKNSKIDEMVQRKSENQELLDSLKLAEEKQMDIISIEAKASRKFAIKLDNLRKKSEDCHKRLTTLGLIPDDSNTNYKNMSLRDQYSELQKCNQKLSQLTNVNQKALVQLKEGQQKIRVLTAEKVEIDKGYESIVKLIDTLEHQKYEVILLTYRQVSKFFTQVFKKLVPEGKAFIDMVHTDSNGNQVSQESSQEQPETVSSGGISADEIVPAFNRIDNFVGVKIRVSFTGNSVTKELNQLSGGQKSIVALSFIFAIQKCDPVPFYLLDEVDHALDPFYRKALADIIEEMSRSCQFITTTFRPELLQSANKFFGVKLRNRVSHVSEISREEANDFVLSSETTQKKRKSVSFRETTEK